MTGRILTRSPALKRGIYDYQGILAGWSHIVAVDRDTRASQNLADAVRVRSSALHNQDQRCAVLLFLISNIQPRFAYPFPNSAGLGFGNLAPENRPSDHSLPLN